MIASADNLFTDEDLELFDHIWDEIAAEEEEAKKSGLKTPLAEAGDET